MNYNGRTKTMCFCMSLVARTDIGFGRSRKAIYYKGMGVFI